MAKVLAIVAEYNPFHNGHLYQINKAKEITNADYVIAIMSGNFTQRGETSIVNKWEKAKMAIKHEVDLVIELPTVFAISSAERFAEGAIRIIKELGIVTHISFGMESENIEDLKYISELLLEEPAQLSDYIKEELKKGNSYPNSRANALSIYLNTSNYNDILSSPNNILAIEYLKAIKKYKLNIEPVGIMRKAASYDDENIHNNYGSSTAIRKLIKENKIEEIKAVVPKASFDILKENVENIVADINSFEKEILYKLRIMSAEEIAQIVDVSEGLENIIKRESDNTNNIEELIDKIKTKRYTRTRIQRILINILIGITKSDYQEIENSKPYIRILGMSEKGKELFSMINSTAIIICSLKKYEKTADKPLKGLEIDKRATNIYTLAYENDSKANLDYIKAIEN